PVMPGPLGGAWRSLGETDADRYTERSQRESTAQAIPQDSMTMDQGAAFEGIPCRAWGTREFDATLTRDVPAARLAEFQSRVRPLADGRGEAVWERLSLGIRQPFHYKLSTGWMGRALRLADRKVRRLPVEQLGAEFGWADDTLVLLVYDAPSSVLA